MIDDKFAVLFRGRVNAYGADEGSCDKIGDEVPDLEGHYMNRIERHLEGAEPMGVYPLMDNLSVMWGCTDLDNGEEIDWPQARNIATMLEAAGLNAWVERSRSKGYHVWSFASEPIPAKVMRDAFLAVHQRLGIPPKEVNPKQTSLVGLKGYGNYVRLPYPGSAPVGCTPNNRQCVVDSEGNQVPFGHFTDDAYAQRSTLAAYEQVAARYVPPPPPARVEIDTEHAADLADIVAGMSGDLRLAFTYGPREGHDRSSSLARLAHLCRESDLTPAEALRVVRDLDRRLGKFVDRVDGEEQLMRLVVNAYK